eukprot:177474-Rhodomonas_salina.1
MPGPDILRMLFSQNLSRRRRRTRKERRTFSSERAPTSARYSRSPYRTSRREAVGQVWGPQCNVRYVHSVSTLLLCRVLH